MAQAKIPGGYVLKARKKKFSEIAHLAPCVREIWDYLYTEANHKEQKYRGFTVQRGQLFRSYQQIAEDLHWMIGYRKVMYSQAQIKSSMKLLTKLRMIIPTRLPRGTLITICNYNYYQDPRNYEATNEATNEDQANHPSINKNDKKEKKELVLPDFVNPEIWGAFKQHRVKMKRPLTPRGETLIINKLIKFKEHGHNPNECLDRSIECGWLSVFEPKREEGSSNTPAKFYKPPDEAADPDIGAKLKELRDAIGDKGME